MLDMKCFKLGRQSQKQTGPITEIEVESLETQSSLFSAQVSGKVATAPSFADAPLNLQVKLQTDPAFSNALQDFGIRVSRDGKATLRIRGTPTAPVMR